MAENKTKPTGASVEDYIASRANAQQQVDCQELMALLHEVTGERPAMWGRHTMGKSCLYVKRLEDLDVGVLAQIVAGSVAEVRRRYG